MDWLSEVQKVQKCYEKRKVKIEVPEGEFPELFVKVPDSWDSIQLAPLYDVHIGNNEHDATLFKKHVSWIYNTPNVLTWNGGDMYENITPAQAAKMGHTALSPEEQIYSALEKIAPIQHKMLFALPGNHEDRTMASGMSGSKRLADYLQLPHFGSYCFCTIRWRGNNFRILAHHGAGGGTTPGAQRNAARKELSWAKPDMLWTGHLHQPMVDTIYLTDVDQATGRLFERNVVAIISPSYLKYFGGYASKARMAPGLRGLSVAVLQPDGRIDVTVHARGKRL